MADSDITDEVSNQQNRILLRLAYAASGTAAVVGISLFGWVLNECMESKQFREITERRLSGLEDGSRTPMAVETRSELNAIWRQIGNKPE